MHGQQNIKNSCRSTESLIHDKELILQIRIVEPTLEICLYIIQKCSSRLTINTLRLNYKKKVPVNFVEENNRCLVLYTKRIHTYVHTYAHNTYIHTYLHFGQEQNFEMLQQVA